MATLLLRSSRSSKVPQAASSLAMPQSRRQNTQQRKTGSYTALPVATRWPPCRRRHPWRHLFRRRARPCCRHIKRNMILTQPGAWSAQPSGLLPGPCNHGRAVPRIMPLVLGEARESWRCPTGGAEHTRSSLSVVQMDAAPVSTAAVASSRPREHPEGPPSAWFVVGGCYIKNQVRDPIAQRRRTYRAPLRRASACSWCRWTPHCP